MLSSKQLYSIFYTRNEINLPLRFENQFACLCLTIKTLLQRCFQYTLGSCIYTITYRLTLLNSIFGIKFQVLKEIQE